MMADMTTEIEFTPEQREVLNYERYHHPVPLVQRRMPQGGTATWDVPEVLWLRSHNLPHALIAKLAGVSQNTIRDYFELFIAGGLEKLKEVHFYRPESELVAHVSSLERCAYFRVNPPATIKEAQSEIETLTGIKRSETQVAEFLKKNSICVAARSA
jgi:transposase